MAGSIASSIFLSQNKKKNSKISCVDIFKTHGNVGMTIILHLTSNRPFSGLSVPSLLFPEKLAMILKTIAVCRSSNIFHLRRSCKSQMRVFSSKWCPWMVRQWVPRLVGCSKGYTLWCQEDFWQRRAVLSQLLQKPASPSLYSGSHLLSLRPCGTKAALIATSVPIIPSNTRAIILRVWLLMLE